MPETRTDVYDKVCWIQRDDAIALFLGQVEVGRLYEPGLRGRKAKWVLNLSGCPAIWQFTNTTAEARQGLGQAFDHWLKRAGLQ